MFGSECTYCNHANAPASNYCTRCGTRLPNVCPSCKTLNDPTARACQNCTVTLRERDGAFAIEPSLSAARSTELAVSGFENGTQAPLPTRSSAMTEASLPSEGAADTETANLGWAGSPPGTSAGSRTRPNVSKTTPTPRSRPLLVTFVIAVIAGSIWYLYRYPLIDIAEQRAQGADRIERDSGSSAANYQSTSPVAAKSETKQWTERDSGGSCTEAVAALGLCSPEPTQRKD